MFFDEVMRAIQAAGEKPQDRERRLLDELRRQNDAAARAAWDAQVRAAQAAQSTPPPVPVRRPVVPDEPEGPPPARPSRPAAATARTIARWARPGTLRTQFVLTEVLKPPLSMRQPRNT